MKELIKQVLPPSLRSAVRGVFDDASDFADRLRGRQDDLMPPRKMIHNIGGSFADVGNTFLRYFIELGGLQPSDKVLDVGCGVGRMAVPLTRYLANPGSYEGFDIDAKEIEWCTRHITSRYPNFRFRTADIQSRRYNPKGAYTAAEYKFPFPDGSFDFLFMTSVFTHILQPGMETISRKLFVS